MFQYKLSMFRKLLVSPTNAQRQIWFGHKLQSRNDNLSAIQFRNQLRQYSSTNENVAVNLNSETGIAVVKWNNRPVNCLGIDFMQNSTATLQSLDKDPNCKAVILTSAIPNIFCAGLDFKEITKPTKESFIKYFNNFNLLWSTIYSMKLPTIVAINGSAPAGGCVMALACDYRIMAKQGTIGLNEVHLGIPIRNWICKAVKNVIGHRHAELVISRGQLYTPQEALAIGLIDELAENDEELIEKAKHHAAMLASLPNTAMHKSKRYIRQPLLDELQNESIQEEQNLQFAEAFTSEEMQSHLDKYLKNLKKK